MKQRIVLIIACVCLLAVSCKDENQKFREKLSLTITEYVEQNLDGFKVDSVSILSIDSLTHLDYAYFRKIVLRNQESDILSGELLYREPVSEEEHASRHQLQSSLKNLQSQIEECDNIIANPTTDTTVIQYFFVATSVYGKQENQAQEKLDIGFPLDKNLKIQEIGKTE